MQLRAQGWGRGLGVAEGVDLHAMRTYRRLLWSSGDYLVDACFAGGFGDQRTRRGDVDEKKEGLLAESDSDGGGGVESGNALGAPAMP